MPVTSETVLDILWLASGPWALDLGGRPPTADAPAAEIVLPEIDELPAPDANATPRGSDRTVAETIEHRQGGYAPIAAASDEAVVAASPVRLPAAQALTNRLPLARALRPFLQPFLSQRASELDEEATAELTAELRVAGLPGVYPVERPERERWFDVHLVLEDDPAAVLWEAQLYEFARILQQSGAFRLVRTWRLRLDPVAPLDLGRAELRPLHQGAGSAGGPGGDRRLPGQIGADRRQLILFASHGASTHWLDGSYARLLLGWSSAAIALLDLLPPDRRAQTALGEPHGLGWAPQAGAPASAFNTELMWWRTDADPEAPGVVRLPMTTLDPATLGNWALAQMARGRKSAVYLLDAAERVETMPLHADKLEPIEIEQRLALLRERSGEAYELAIAISIGPFTLPVARIVQEVLFGSATDTTLLADLLLSGLVAIEPPPPGARGDELVFRVTDLARASLARALRTEDRLRLVDELQDRIGAHLGAKAPGGFSFTVLFRDPDGTAKLPLWLNAFMRFAQPLVGSLRPTERTPDPPIEREADPIAWETDALERIPAMDMRRQGQLHRLMTRGEPLSETSVRPDLWRWLRAENLVGHAPDGGWEFRPSLLPALQAAIGPEPLLGLRLLWVDDHPRNNRAIEQELRQRGVDIAEALSTGEAMARSDLGFIDIVLSDMSRPPERQAGFDLIAGLEARGLTMPVIIYAGYFAQDPSNRQRVLDAGGFACTNDPGEVVELVARAAYASVGTPAPPAPAKSLPSLSSVRRGIVAQIAARYGPGASDTPAAPLDPLVVARARLVSLIRSRAAEQDETPETVEPARLQLIVDPSLAPGTIDAVQLFLQFSLLAADRAERQGDDEVPVESLADGAQAKRPWDAAFYKIVSQLGWVNSARHSFEGLSTADGAYETLAGLVTASERVAGAMPPLRRLVDEWEFPQTSGPTPVRIDFSSDTDFPPHELTLGIAVLTGGKSDRTELNLSVLMIHKVELERRSLLFFRLAPRLRVESFLASFDISARSFEQIVSAIRARLERVTRLPGIRTIWPPDDDPGSARASGV